MPGQEIVERVAELRRAGRTPKEIARALGMKPAEVAPLIRAVGTVAPKREAPLAGCWVSGGWAASLSVKGHPDWPGITRADPEHDGPGLASVLVARDNGSTVSICGYLVDAWCLGVKDTLGPRSVDRRKLPEFVSRYFSTGSLGPPVTAPLELARHLVFGAVDYARGMGLEPHPDFARGSALLGEWAAGGSDITFGRDGRPTYINGPHDDTYRILATLRRKVGARNFDVVLGTGPRPID